MMRIKICFLFLITINLTFSQWIKLQVRSEIPGSLYIDNRKIRDISEGDIYSGRYPNGKYVLTLKNSKAIYQKEIELYKENKVFYKITKDDLIKELVSDKPKVIIVEKEKIVEKIVEKPVEKIIEKTIEIVSKEEKDKPLKKIEENNFKELVIKKLKNGEAYDPVIKFEKYSIIEDEKTKYHVYLENEKGKKTKLDSRYITRHISKEKYPSDYGVVLLEYYLRFKPDFYKELTSFYSSFGKNMMKDINIRDFDKENYESFYVVSAKNSKAKKRNLVDKLVEVNHIEKRELTEYIEALEPFKRIDPKFDILTTDGDVYLGGNLRKYQKEILGADDIGRGYEIFYRSNMSGISFGRNEIALLDNDGVVKEVILIVLPLEEMEKIENIRIRSIF